MNLKLPIHCTVISCLFALILHMYASCANSPPSLDAISEYKTVPVFAAWSLSEDTEEMDYWQRIAKYDLYFADTWPLLHVGYNQGDALPYRGLITELDQGSVSDGADLRIKMRVINPDLNLIATLEYREGSFKSLAKEGGDWWEKGHFPPDSPYWLRDENDEPVVGWGEDTNLNGRIDENDEILTYLIDFTNPEVQDLIAARAASLYQSGVFDGVFFDWMNEFATTDNAVTQDWDPLLSSGDELAARVALLRKVRAATGDDFILMGNSNYYRNETLAPLLNAVFMECYKNPYYETYTDTELRDIEEAVIFNQHSLLPPAIVCLEGWRICYEYEPDKETRIENRRTAENLRMMRFFTTMSLTLTDGCVLFSDDNAIPFWDHGHNFYPFWEAPLGRAIGAYQTLYNNTDGVYIREFENGWAVYNFSGSGQQISLPQRVTAYSRGESGLRFTVPDKDGEIFLITTSG